MESKATEPVVGQHDLDTGDTGSVAVPRPEGPTAPFKINGLTVPAGFVLTPPPGYGPVRGPTPGAAEAPQRTYTVAATPCHSDPDILAAGARIAAEFKATSDAVDKIRRERMFGPER